MRNGEIKGDENPLKYKSNSYKQNIHNNLSKTEREYRNAYSCEGLVSFLRSVKNPTIQALAIEFARMGFPVFPCRRDKTPIVDQSLGFTHGHKDAALDMKEIARAWVKYPDAAIGFAIPHDIIVMDCDIPSLF